MKHYQLFTPESSYAVSGLSLQEAIDSFSNLSKEEVVGIVECDYIIHAIREASLREYDVKLFREGTKFSLRNEVFIVTQQSLSNKWIGYDLLNSSDRTAFTGKGFYIGSEDYKNAVIIERP